MQRCLCLVYTRERFTPRNPLKFNRISKAGNVSQFSTAMLDREILLNDGFTRRTNKSPQPGNFAVTEGLLLAARGVFSCKWDYCHAAVLVFQFSLGVASGLLCGFCLALPLHHLVTNILGLCHIGFGHRPATKISSRRQLIFLRDLTEFILIFLGQSPVCLVGSTETGLDGYIFLVFTGRFKGTSFRVKQFSRRCRTGRQLA